MEVHLSGDVSQGLVGSVPGPPPMCWWEPYHTLDTVKVDPSDPEAVQKYYNEEVPSLAHRPRRHRSAGEPGR